MADISQELELSTNEMDDAYFVCAVPDTDDSENSLARRMSRAIMAQVVGNTLFFVDMLPAAPAANQRVELIEGVTLTNIVNCRVELTGETTEASFGLGHINLTATDEGLHLAVNAGQRTSLKALGSGDRIVLQPNAGTRITYRLTGAGEDGTLNGITTFFLPNGNFTAGSRVEDSTAYDVLGQSWLSITGETTLSEVAEGDVIFHEESDKSIQLGSIASERTRMSRMNSNDKLTFEAQNGLHLTGSNSRISALKGLSGASEIHLRFGGLVISASATVRAALAHIGVGGRIEFRNSDVNINDVYITLSGPGSDNTRYNNIETFSLDEDEYTQSGSFANARYEMLAFFPAGTVDGEDAAGATAFDRSEVQIGQDSSGNDEVYIGVWNVDSGFRSDITDLGNGDVLYFYNSAGSFTVNLAGSPVYTGNAVRNSLSAIYISAANVSSIEGSIVDNRNYQIFIRRARIARVNFRSDEASFGREDVALASSHYHTFVMSQAGTDGYFNHEPTFFLSSDRYTLDDSNFQDETRYHIGGFRYIDEVTGENTVGSLASGNVIKQDNYIYLLLDSEYRTMIRNAGNGAKIILKALTLGEDDITVDIRSAPRDIQINLVDSVSAKATFSGDITQGARYEVLLRTVSYNKKFESTYDDFDVNDSAVVVNDYDDVVVTMEAAGSETSYNGVTTFEFTDFNHTGDFQDGLGYELQMNNIITGFSGETTEANFAANDIMEVPDREVNLYLGVSAVNQAKLETLQNGAQITLDASTAADVTFTMTAAGEEGEFNSVTAFTVAGDDYSKSGSIVDGRSYTVRTTWDTGIDLTSRTITQASAFAASTISISGGNLYFQIASSQHGIFTALRSGDVIELSPSSGTTLTLTLTATPTTGSLNNHSVINLAAGYSISGGNLANGTTYSIIIKHNCGTVAGETTGSDFAAGEVHEQDETLDTYTLHIGSRIPAFGDLASDDTIELVHSNSGNNVTYFLYEEMEEDSLNGVNTYSLHSPYLDRTGTLQNGESYELHLMHDSENALREEDMEGNFARGDFSFRITDTDYFDIAGDSTVRTALAALGSGDTVRLRTTTGEDPSSDVEVELTAAFADASPNSVSAKRLNNITVNGEETTSQFIMSGTIVDDQAYNLILETNEGSVTGETTEEDFAAGSAAIEVVDYLYLAVDDVDKEKELQKLGNGDKLWVGSAHLSLSAESTFGEYNDARCYYWTARQYTVIDDTVLQILDGTEYNVYGIDASRTAKKGEQYVYDKDLGYWGYYKRDTDTLPSGLGSCQYWVYSLGTTGPSSSYAQLQALVDAESYRTTKYSRDDLYENTSDPICIARGNPTAGGFLPDLDNYWGRIHYRCKAKTRLTAVQWLFDGHMDDAGKWAVVEADRAGEFPSNPERQGTFAVTTYTLLQPDSSLLTIANPIPEGAVFFIEVWHQEAVGDQEHSLQVKFNATANTAIDLAQDNSNDEFEVIGYHMENQHDFIMHVWKQLRDFYR